MSKTSQRRKSAYALGQQDARNNLYMRWLRHPYLKEYKAGYQSVRNARKRKLIAVPLQKSFISLCLTLLRSLRQWNANRRQRRFNRRYHIP